MQQTEDRANAAAERAFALSALRAQPGNVAILHRLGQICRSEGQHGEAIRWFTRALAIAAGDSVLWQERALVYLAMRRPAEAVIDLDEALRCAGAAASADIWHDRACALMDLGDPAAAEADCLRAVAIDAGHPKAWTLLALARLTQGRMGSAWEAYEWRRAAAGLVTPSEVLHLPLWDGKTALAGRHILLSAEQGLGDVLQFCRYAPLVAARGGRVLLHLPGPLTRLLRGIEGVAGFLEDGAVLSAEVALQSPLMSLPRAFTTTLATIPASVPYLHPPAGLADSWAARLAAVPRPRVGIAWSGNPAHPRDAERSLPLAALLAAIPPGWSIVSLQTQTRAEDAAILSADLRVHAFAAEIADFADTAALVQQTSLVISADTSVAHLAGALGHPLWLLLPYAADWRWLRDRADSPWYPAARLLRQRRAGDWSVPLDELRHRFAALG